VTTKEIMAYFKGPGSKAKKEIFERTLNARWPYASYEFSHAVTVALQTAEPQFKTLLMGVRLNENTANAVASKLCRN
jgi:hypothetical protein